MKAPKSDEREVAKRCLRQICTYWEARGFKVTVTIEPLKKVRQAGVAIACLRSDLKNGLPTGVGKIHRPPPRPWVNSGGPASQNERGRRQRAAIVSVLTKCNTPITSAKIAMLLNIDRTTAVYHLERLREECGVELIRPCHGPMMWRIPEVAAA